MERLSKISIARIARCAAWFASTALLVSAAQIEGQNSSSVTTQLVNHVPEKLTNGSATLVGHYNPDQKLRLALAVAAPHMAEEEEFLKELSTKGSPGYHKFLTLEQWNTRFAPAVEDEQKVVDWAKSQGLTVTKRFPNRLLVDVEAPAGNIEKAFGLTINNYQVGDETDFSNDRDPVIPSSLKGILYSVMGLNSIDRVHGKMAETRHAKGPDYVPGPAYVVGKELHGDGDPNKDSSHVRAALKAGKVSPRPSFTNGYADPGDIFTSQAYNWDGLEQFSHCCNVFGASNGSPKETSIALATYAGFTVSDVEAFFANYGFAYEITPLAIDGTNGTPGTECDTLDSGCTSPPVDDEATLDTEYATASANSYGSEYSTAHVYVYEGVNQLYNTITDMFNYMLNDENARVMSTSWSGAEATSGNNYTYYEVPNHAIFNNMVGVGWTLIGDADDQGSTGDCATISVNFPASDNNFVAAGGTALGLYSDGTWAGENAWTGGTGSTACQNNDGGGGGGVSALWGQPSWQAQYPSIAELGSNRLEPDISLNAGGIGENYYYQGSLQPVGGTSIVAPELAGFFAQENSYLSYIGSICGSGDSACAPLGNPNPYMYYAGGSGAHHNPYYDITNGCTSNNITIANNLTPWCAGTGFDLATGWGSANMMQLAWAINWELIPAYGEPSISFSGPSINTWYNSSQTVSWTISDSDAQGVPAPGVAGFTQGWDSIPADPASEPHGGSGNSFYSGPEFPFGTSGCLTTGTGGCGGGVTQGCHTVYVEAWDNQGATATSTYGPVCYDTVAPVATISLSGTAPVTVGLSATDASSGVSAIYYQLDGGSFVTYSSPFNVSTAGSHTVNYYAVDVAGNTESTQTKTFTVSSSMVLSLSATTLAFGNDTVGVISPSQTVTVTNTGNSTVTLTSIVLGGTNPSDYQFANSCGSTLASGANCTIHGHFDPTTTGSLPATITIKDNATGSPQTIALTGTGTPAPPAVKLSATSLSFPSTLVGSTSTLSFTITNSGGSTLSVSAISNTGTNPSDFSHTSNCGGNPLAAGKSCTVEATFTPAAAGTFSATMNITDNATGSPQKVTLTGTGTTPAPVAKLSATTLSFPSTAVGSTSTLPLTITNSGGGTLSVSAIANTGTNPTDFSHTSNCGGNPLAAGKSCTVEVTFTPAETGSFSATLNITDNATGSPQKVTLTGTGTATGPIAKLSATSLSFPSTAKGSTSTLPLTITNAGSGTLSVSAIANTGTNPTDFSHTSNCGGNPLAAGASCTAEVTFTPAAAGSFSATLNITDNATGSPQKVTLTGTGH
jgi:hypothetical protein